MKELRSFIADYVWWVGHVLILFGGWLKHQAFRVVKDEEK